jgi:hypothetical protein
MGNSSAKRAANGSSSGSSKTRRAPRPAGAEKTAYINPVARELVDVGIVDAAQAKRLARELADQLGETALSRDVAALLRARIDAWIGPLAEARGVRPGEAVVAGRAALLALNGEHAWSDDFLAAEPSRAFQTAFSQVLPVACPPDAPLAMPVQSLRRWAPDAPEDLRARRRSLASWRRPALILGAALASTGLGGYELSQVMKVGGYSPLEIALLVLFVPNFLWIAVSFWTAVAGLVAMFRRLPVRGLA